MYKKIFITIATIIAIGVIGYLFVPQNHVGAPSSQSTTLDVKNCTYNIDGQNITLKDGYSEQEIAPGSASKTITRYFGNEATGDFNGDGYNDTAFILTQDSGGSGIFYYIAVALGGINGCRGTNAILLGDRIAPQDTTFQNGEIIANYADRGADESTTTQPSIGISKYFKISSDQLVRI